MGERRAASFLQYFGARLRLYAARAAFVVLSALLLILDVDDAFTSGHGDPSAMVAAAVLFVGWFAVYAWLWQITGRPR